MRLDKNGRDVTDLPGLWDESDVIFDDDTRDVLVRIKATPEGLRNIASFLEAREVGQSVRVNWYTVQIEFVKCDKNCAVC